MINLLLIDPWPDQVQKSQLVLGNMPVPGSMGWPGARASSKRETMDTISVSATATGDREERLLTYQPAKASHFCRWKTGVPNMESPCS
jgi:hypothetical protein